MRIEVSRLIHAPKMKVFDWCTNFQETDPEYSRARLRGRKILDRTPERVLLEENGVMIMPFKARFEVKLHAPDRWEADAESNLGTAHNEYMLTDAPDGTRLDMRFNILLKGWMRPLSLLVKPYVRSRIQREWDDYVRAMEKEIPNDGPS